MTKTHDDNFMGRDWDNIFKAGGFPLEEPHPALFTLCKLFKERKFQRICDLCCGMGRNLIYLAQQGFDVYGIDFSTEGLSKTRKKAEKVNFKIELKQSDMTKIPYPNHFFDATICIYAIYHNSLENIMKTLAEINRVLHKGGILYVSFQTLRSHKYGQGKQIEDHTFVQDSYPELGIIHHFSSEDEVKGLMKAFHVIKLELEEFKTEDGKTHSHWQVLAETI